ncbi:hypothetical protein SEA_TAYLORSIPHT_1 [Arthrobacter phage TaylorSipht]|nr:hypothetical protein SEA_TAYLORSIPHT_1 [Arthrobacter phage TaylorSipht]
MHDEHKQGAILAAVVEGQRVAIFAATLPAAQELHRQLADLVDKSAVECVVRRTSGAHSLAFVGGGSIVFLSYRSGVYRGMSLDRIFVPIGTGAELVRDLSPCLAVSGGPFVGY